MLVRLPFDELRALLPKLKDRVLFTEKRDILIKEGNNTASEQIVGEDILKGCNKQTFDIRSESQVTTATQDLLDDTPPPPSCNDMDNETIETTSNIDSQANEDEQDLEEQQQKLPLDFQFVSLPEEIQVIVDENELTKLRGHTNHRRILLNFVFQHVVNTYKLLYPKANDYFIIIQALLKALKIPITDEDATNEWHEAIKQKFKNERRLLQKISSLVKRKKEKFGKGCGRPAKKSQVLSAERQPEKLIYVSSTMDEYDLEQLVTKMKEGIENATIDNDEMNILWKKTFGYRRLFIRSHTTNEVLEKFPGYSYPCLIFEEVKMIDNVDVEQNTNEILPGLFDKLPNNALFVMDVLPIRIIKLLCKQFAQSISQVLVDKDPLVPTPCIKISNENFQLYLDWQVVVETKNPTTALALLLSLYSVFEVKFTKNNHTSHLLYGVIFQDGDQLGKNLRILLNSWGFTYQDRTKQSQIRTTNSIDYVNIQTTQQLQLPSTATTTDNVYSSTTLDTSSNEPPQSSQSMSSTIFVEQQLRDNSLTQINEAENMDIDTKPQLSSRVHSKIQQTPDVTDKFSDSFDIEQTVLKDTTNRKTATTATKGGKRKLPSSPPPRKFSSRLAAKRSRQNISSSRV